MKKIRYKTHLSENNYVKRDQGGVMVVKSLATVLLMGLWWGNFQQASGTGEIVA